MIVSNGKFSRDWKITVENIDGSFVVEHMFDITGSETFDPTEAVEYVNAETGEALSIEVGDKFCFEVIED